MRIFLFVFTFILMACQGHEPMIDPYFTNSDLKALKLNLKAIERVKLELPAEFKQSSRGKAFAQLFPNYLNDETAFGEYFNQRISYILPHRTKIYSPSVWA